MHEVYEHALAHYNDELIQYFYFPDPTANTDPVYFVDDEQIDFDRVLREEKITPPKGASWTAHWLAVEGAQPLIPKNPPEIPKDVESRSRNY